MPTDFSDSSRDADRPLTRGAVAASAACFIVGIPVCAAGLVMLRAAAAAGAAANPWFGVAWIVVGAALCAAGMWLKGGEPTRGS